MIKMNHKQKLIITNVQKLNTRSKAQYHECNVKVGWGSYLIEFCAFSTLGVIIRQNKET